MQKQKLRFCRLNEVPWRNYRRKYLNSWRQDVEWCTYDTNAQTATSFSIYSLHSIPMYSVVLPAKRRLKRHQQWEPKQDK